MNVLSLCTGIGGMELGLRLVLGKQVHVSAIVEREGYCLEVLAARCREGWLDDAAVFTDLRTFDGHPYAGRVDLITAGFPCQPHSVAGKRRGEHDERDLWPDVRRVVAEVGPALVFLENVPGAMRFFWRFVIPDLRRLGYRVASGLFSAAEVGAPHRRVRLFVLADNRQPLMERRTREGLSREGRQAERPDENGDELPAWPPGPASLDDWQRVLAIDPSLEPAVSNPEKPGQLRAEQQANRNSSAPGVCPNDFDTTHPGTDGSGEASQPTLRRVVTRLPHRVDRLAALGNSVVPLVAAKAFATLAAELEETP